MSEWVQAWRLVKSQHAATAFDGEGAFRFGGRWNHRGCRVVYASGSLALALLEVLVHLDPAGRVPALTAIPIQLPQSLIDIAPMGAPSSTADAVPLPIGTTRQIGDTWIQTAHRPALRIPSAIVPIEHNYLLNPEHQDFHRIHIGQAEPLLFDPRLRNG